MATPISQSHCLSSQISALAYPRSVRNIKTPPFPSAHPQIDLPFPSLSRLKRMGAGLVMFTLHTDASLNSAGGPGSAWSRRLPCLLTIFFAPGAPAYHTGLELLGDWKLRMNSTQPHQLVNLTQPWWPVMFTNMSRNHKLISCWPVFYYQRTDSRGVDFFPWTQV